MSKDLLTRTSLTFLQLREERRAELEQHVKTVNSLVERDEDQTDGENEDDGSQSEDWQGFAEPVIVDHEDKFVDDDRYTTVTVEAVDVTREGLERVRSESEDACAAVEDGLGERGKEKTSETRAQDQAQGASVAKRKWSKENSNKSRMGHRKFRYESKGQRKLSRLKQAAANRAQAKKRKGQA